MVIIRDAVKRIRRSLNQRRADEKPDSWITLENGEHVPLDATGHAIGGAGGWDNGKDFSRAKSTTAKTKKPDKAKGMELFRKFVEGGSYDVHKLLGVEMLQDLGKYDPDSVDKEAAEAIDSVFTPASGIKPLYKGVPMTEEMIDDLKSGNVFKNHTLSSTSSDPHTARSYADNAYDTEDLIPVYMKINVEDGTPVANVQELLGNSGMKGFEQEITVGRNTEWEYGKVENVGDDDDPYYEVEVTVRPMSKQGRKDEEDWITVNGTHVLIDKETGDISKGPEGLKKWSSEKKPDPKGSGSFSSGPPTAGNISDSMKPKSAEYDFDLDDDMDDFLRKNAGNRRRPTPLYMLFNEVEDSGGDGMQVVEDEYFKSRLSKCTEGLKEISKDEAEEILYDNLRPGTLQAWFREYNHEAKEGLVWQMTRNPETHNAALNQMYTNYKYYCQSEGKDPLPFEEFLVTPIKMYRGGTGKEYDGTSLFSSYTFDRKVAESFTGSEVGQGAKYDPNGVVYEAEIRPIDTYGSVYTNGESEVLVPRPIAPNKNRDSADEDGGALSIEDRVDRIRRSLKERRKDEGLVLEEEVIILPDDEVPPEPDERYVPEMFSSYELAAMFAVYGNEYTEGKFIDIAGRHDTIKMKGGSTHGDEEPKEWITLENGQPVPLDESGKAIGGAGGWAKGKDFSKAKGGNGKKKRTSKRYVKGGKSKKPVLIVVKPLAKKKPEEKAAKPAEAESQKKPDEKPEEAKEQTVQEKPSSTKEKTENKPKEKQPEKKEQVPEKGTVDKPSARGENVPCIGMKNDRCIKDHEYHYEEVGVSSEEEYNKKAIDFIKQPCGGDIDGYLRDPGPNSWKKPVVVRFNRKTGELGMGIPGSFFLSYYKAKYDEKTGTVDIKRANIYFDKMKKRESGE